LVGRESSVQSARLLRVAREWDREEDEEFDHGDDHSGQGQCALGGRSQIKTSSSTLTHVCSVAPAAEQTCVAG